MAVAIVVEDGTGKADANSYVSVAEADAFHEANFHSSDWPSDSDTKAKLLVTATRILDQQWRWVGAKATEAQSLQWPRTDVPDPDMAGGRDLMPEDEVPPAIKRATCDFARAIATRNYEAAPDGQGIRAFRLEGVMDVEFDLSTRPDFLPDWIASELSKYGSLATGRAKMVNLTRA